LGDGFLADEALGVLRALSLLPFQGALVAAGNMATGNENTVSIFLKANYTSPVSPLVVEF